MLAEYSNWQYRERLTTDGVDSSSVLPVGDAQSGGNDVSTFVAVITGNPPDATSTAEEVNR